MTSTPELLPCPFCGGKAQISRAHQNKMLAMGEVATDEHYLFTLHHTCNPALNDGVTVCWTYKPKAVLVAAWNRRTTTTPTDDEREAVIGSADDLFWSCRDMDRGEWVAVIAAALKAAEARGVEMERARVVAWLRNDPDAHYKPYDAIERGEHDTGKDDR